MEAERLLHLLTDIQIMQCECNALEICMTARMQRNESVDSEERAAMQDLMLRVATRLRVKSHALYMNLRKHRDE